MHPHEGLHYDWGLCCSLGSIPDVRRTGQPKAKSPGSLSLCMAAEVTALVYETPPPPAHGPVATDQGVAVASDVSRNPNAVFGARGSPVSNINSRRCERELKSSILLRNYRLSEFYVTCVSCNTSGCAFLR